MAKYIFECDSCKLKQHRYVLSTIETLPCKCGKTMTRLLPILGGTTDVREVVDQYTNRVVNKDQDKLVKDRRDDHYWNVIVPRLIETHSVLTSLEQKWLRYNDKGELVINRPTKS